MEGFQKIVLYSAIIILIIILVLIGIALSYSKNETWPPMVPSCPDWWIVDGSGNNATCVDVKDLANDMCRGNSKDVHLKKNFNTAQYSGSNGNCSKYNWANSCGVSWDGITYGVTNPCSS
jgi:hypothetical protein